MIWVYKLLASQDFSRDVERFAYFMLFQTKLPRKGLSAGSA